MRMIVEKREVAAHLATLKKRIAKRSVRQRMSLGYQGGNEDFVGYWCSEHDFWCVFSRAEGRHWNALGIGEPKLSQSSSIACEINMPFKGVNLRVAGMFVQHGGDVFIAHTGKIGGGREGVGKERFLEEAPYEMVPVEVPGRGEVDVVLVARLGDPKLVAHLGLFVHQVQEIKDRIVGATFSTSRSCNRAEFRPEFHGERRGYQTHGQVRAVCGHGAVVNRLHALLRERTRHNNLLVWNSQQCDLMVGVRRGMPHVLFEVKTDTSTGSVYKAVGQLLLNAEHRDCKRILVVPLNPLRRTELRLRKLGIRCARYREIGKRISFEGLPPLAKR